MPETRCPRCLSSNVDLSVRTCLDCRIAYDKVATFQYPSREHTMVRARWAKWRTVDREGNARKRIARLLGLD